MTWLLFYRVIGNLVITEIIFAIDSAVGREGDAHRDNESRSSVILTVGYDYNALIHVLAGNCNVCIYSGLCELNEATVVDRSLVGCFIRLY